MKAITSIRNNSSNLNTHSINHFYLDFPQNLSIMENQMKNRKIKSNILKEESLTSPFSKEIQQIILGSLLGDMYCGKESLNSTIQETHSIKQKDYLNWKYSKLKNVLNLRLYTFKSKSYDQIRLHSKVSSKLNEYYSMFYPNNRKIVSLKILNRLDPLGLAVWYCDDGYYDPESHIVHLHTEGFSFKENIIIKKWFKEKYKIKTFFKKHSSKNKIHLVFSVKESNKFLKIVKLHILSMPKLIWYKLGHLCRDNADVINEARLNKSRRTKIYQSRIEVKSRKNQQAKELYKKNRGKILKIMIEYRKTDRYRNYIKQYLQKPSVRKKMKIAQMKYRQKPENKVKISLYRKEYRKRPEAREKIRLYNKKARERRNGG